VVRNVADAASRPANGFGDLRVGGGPDRVGRLDPVSVLRLPGLQAWHAGIMALGADAFPPFPLKWSFSYGEAIGGFLG
jgi:hypothetical protein